MMATPPEERSGTASSRSPSFPERFPVASPSLPAHSRAASPAEVARRTTLLYAMFGAVWIAGSDLLVSWLFADAQTIATVSLFKGELFVGLTAFLLYVTLRAQLRQLHRENLRSSAAAQELAIKESQLSNALRMANAGHWELDNATGLFTFNDLFYAVLHTTAAAEGGYQMAYDHYLRRFLPPSAIEKVKREVQQAKAPGGTAAEFFLEHDAVFADGTRGRLAVRSILIRDASGAVIRSHGVTQDVTQRDATEAALRRSEERLQIASRVGQVGTFERDYRTGSVHISPFLQEMDGFATPDEPWEHVLRRVVPEDHAAFVAAFRAAEDPAGNGRVLLVHRMRQADDTIHWHHVQAQTWFEGEGADRRPVRMIGSVRDITQQRAAEEQLRADELRYRSLFENMLNGLARCRMLYEGERPVDFIYLEVNRAFETLTGLKDVVGRRVSDVIPGILQTDAALFELYARVVATGRPESSETYVAALKQWFALSIYRPAPGEFVVVFDVITERKRTEEHLYLLSRTIEQSPVSIMITDPAGAIEYVNPRFCETSGYTAEEVIGRNPRIMKSGLNSPEMYRQLWTTIMAGHEWVGDLHNRRRTGETFWERVRIAPVTDEHGAIAHLVAMKEDITEHRKLEDQLRRAQRVEAIGTLASGIAHDMNNILAPILLTPMLLRQQLSGACEQELAIIEQSAQRAADLVRQLLVFSRGSAGDRVPLRMQRLIQEMRSIVTETFPREITLRVDVGPNLLPVLGDSTQLHQVLLNLCVNARDAMPKGGLLTIAAENTVVDASQARLHPPAKAGPHVVVRVSDTGFGMSHEVLERVFDPFFTTKPEGQGTGIGLSTVLGIVRGHQGFITVSSVMDKGSTFCVYLPVAEAEAGNAIGPVSALAQARGELILVVDDEPLVRASSEQVLRQHGYRVVTAADGTEALAAYQLHAAEIALVLTDVMMPIMNGVDLVRALRERQPTLKIVIATGMASDANIHDLTGLGVTGILAKPNSARELLETVSRALGTSSTPGVPAGSA